MLYIYALAVNNLYKKESAQNCRGFFISFPHICCIPPMMFHKDTTELGIIFVFHAYCLKRAGQRIDIEGIEKTGLYMI